MSLLCCLLGKAGSLTFLLGQASFFFPLPLVSAWLWFFLLHLAMPFAWPRLQPPSVLYKVVIKTRSKYKRWVKKVRYLLAFNSLRILSSSLAIRFLHSSSSLAHSALRRASSSAFIFKSKKKMLNNWNWASHGGV